MTVQVGAPDRCHCGRPVGADPRMLITGGDHYCIGYNLRTGRGPAGGPPCPHCEERVGGAVIDPPGTHNAEER